MAWQEAMSEQCAICGCRVHRVASSYAPTGVDVRSHAFQHYFVAERFFGRSKTRRGVLVDGIFPFCPWMQEGQSVILCYECHKELLGNPVLLPGEVARFADLVKRRGLREEVKTQSRAPIAGRVELLHEVIALGLNAALEREAWRARKRSLGEYAPLIAGFGVMFILLAFNAWIDGYSSSENISAQGWIFFLAGLLGCAAAPGRPFRVAFLGTAGVLAGTVAGIVVHVIVSNAMGWDPHHGFSPLTIASHASMAAPGLLLSALIWKAGSASFFWDMGHLRGFAEGRIQAQRRKLMDGLPEDVATMKSRRAAIEGSAEEEVLLICCNALYKLAETVLTQYDSVVSELLVPNTFAVKRLIDGVPGQLQPLFDECLVHARREANLGGQPETTAKCVGILQARFNAICEDVALTLNASLAERRRSLMRELTGLAHRFSVRIPKLVWGAHR